MNPSELFDLWAPPAAVWSKWAKPVLFADSGALPGANPALEPLPVFNLPADRQTALVVDLPSSASVKAGLGLAKNGFRPVPLFNGARGPSPVLSLEAAAVVNNEPILACLVAGADLLLISHLPFDAPPAFLLDSNRRPQVVPAPGRFDNRWIVFPQDFPSAGFLRAQGIARIVLIQSDAQSQPKEDLAHVLRRWQEAGLALLVVGPEMTSEPQLLVVARPSRFRYLWYAALAVMGLRRSSAGGFGSIVPQPSSGG